MTPKQYQQHVLTLLRAAYPDQTFEASDDPLIIGWGETQLGLQNLYASYTRDQPNAPDRDARIREHFAAAMWAAQRTGDDSLHDWDAAKEKVRLQFVPYSHTAGFHGVTFPFTDEVEIAVVVDLPQAYYYVKEADSERWNVTSDEIYRQALSNLGDASVELEIQGSEGPERLLAIATGDGYDAARVLLPAVRELAAEQLGEPCYAGIPNRDFLILWSRSNSNEFHRLTRDQIRSDHQSQPYPLTADIFLVTRKGIKTDAVG